jgi:hypothetical protein
VRDADLEARARLEHAAEDQDRDHDRVLHDDAEAIVEPVAPRALHHEVVEGLRMVEEHRPHRFRRLEEVEEPGLVPVLAVHHRIELGALEPEHGDRALELPDGGADVLHGQRGEAREAPRPLTHHGRDLVVDLTGQRLPRGGVEVIPEEWRVNGQDLHVHALARPCPGGAPPA